MKDFYHHKYLSVGKLRELLASQDDDAVCYPNDMQNIIVMSRPPVELDSDEDLDNLFLGYISFSDEGVFWGKKDLEPDDNS